METFFVLQVSGKKYFFRIFTGNDSRKAKSLAPPESLFEEQIQACDPE
jgi:hypothetical protein